MRLAEAGWRRTSALHHRGNGPVHLDIVIEAGAVCVTVRLETASWRWQPPHRRRYLTYSGPISPDRGVAQQRWRGFSRLVRCPQGWALVLNPHPGPTAELLSLVLRRDGVVLPVRITHSRPCPWRTLGSIRPPPKRLPPAICCAGARCMPPPSKRR